MLKLLFLIFINAVMVNYITAQTIDVIKFDPAKLSPKGQAAYQQLLKAEEFEEPMIREGEELTKGIENYNILLDEKYADEANKALLTEATIAGQLYALCGLYYTDNDFFKKSVEKYKGDLTLVIRSVGEIRYLGKVSIIIESTEPNVAIIPPNETLRDWWSKVKGSYQIDIINGGFPASFRRFKDFYKDKS